ncbi:MAG TPA: PaaI family thioesterase [Caulobacteraceae bacterium]|nr:PaaI family thioesterase [Caulobacteraceae bacterium]
MSETTAEAAPALTDDDILQRFLRTKNQPTGSQTLGFRMLSVSQETKTVEVAFEARAELLSNPMKQVQGGYLCAMLDECMSVACMVASGMTCVAPTAEMKTSFFRPATPGPLRGVGRVVRWGKTLAFTEGEIYDEQGRLLAKATGTAVPTPFKSYK